jgi:hypothetical protein
MGGEKAKRPGLAKVHKIRDCGLAFVCVVALIIGALFSISTTTKGDAVLGSTMMQLAFARTQTYYRTHIVSLQRHIENL